MALCYGCSNKLIKSPSGIYWPPGNRRHSVPGVVGLWAWSTKQLHLVCKTKSLRKKNHSWEARSRDRDPVSVKYPWGASGSASGNCRPLQSSGSKAWDLAASPPLGSQGEKPYFSSGAVWGRIPWAFWLELLLVVASTMYEEHDFRDGFWPWGFCGYPHKAHTPPVGG